MTRNTEGVNSTVDITKYLQKKPVDIHWTPKENRWERKFLNDMSNFKDEFSKKLDLQFQQHIQTKRTPKRNPSSKVLSAENSGNNSATMYDKIKNKSVQKQIKNIDSNVENQDPNIQSPTMYDLVKSKSRNTSEIKSVPFQGPRHSNSDGFRQKHRSSSGSKQKQILRSSVKRSSSNTGVQKIVGTSTPGPTDTKFVKNLTSDFKLQYTNNGPSPFKLKTNNTDIVSQLFTDNKIQTPSTRGRASTAKQRSRRPSTSTATPRISKSYQDDEIQVINYNNNILFNMQDTLKVLNLSSQKKEIKNLDQSKKIKVRAVNKIGRNQEIWFFTQQGINECVQISNYKNKDDFSNWIQQCIDQ